MRTTSAVLATLVLVSVACDAAAPAPTSGLLQVYVVDVEGGNATLIVSPTGESLLIDSGNPSGGRDADRIVAAAQDAGVSQIDHLITTHYHRDHYGGVSELAAKMPIRHFVDHGPNAGPLEPGGDLEAAYRALAAKAKNTAVKPGDRIPIGGVDVRVVTSNGAVTAPLPGAGQANSLCAAFKPGTNNLEDPMSVGVHLTFGRFRAIHLGDLTRNKEFELMCPNNRLGTVDVILGAHHGQATSNSAVLIHAVRPRVIIMTNSARKGAEVETQKTIFSSPGLEDLWQMHFSWLSGQEYTVPGMFIANTVDDQTAAVPAAPMPLPLDPGTPFPEHNGVAYWFKLSAEQDGSYTVTNARNGFAKTYRP